MNARGEQGERLACAFLERQGYRILARNYRARRGEIDVVAWHGETLAFVEVRARQADGVDPLETIDRGKRRRILAAALQYLSRFPEWPRLRFDVVAVRFTESDAEPDVELLQDAFQPGF